MTIAFSLCSPAMTPASLVKQARESAGLTQAELAQRLGTTQPVVARLERRGSNPTWVTLVRALNATGHELELTRRPRSSVPLDIGQLRERLRLTPAERLQAFEESQRNMNRLQAKARRLPRE
jgi:transcriptional regulator with XRE-family HTH domain